MGSGKKVTVGYQYYMGLHFGLCHGPVDSLKEIIIGERSAWTGDQTSSGTTAVFAPQLFGGEEREGGIGGDLDVMMGEATQAQNDYLVSKIGSSVPAFRGILSAVFRQGYIAANNPYVKPWAFRVTRIFQGWKGGSAWYPEKAAISREAAEIFTDDCSSLDDYTLTGTPGAIRTSGAFIYSEGSAAPNTNAQRMLGAPFSADRVTVDFSINLREGDAMVFSLLNETEGQIFVFNPRRQTVVDSANRPFINDVAIGSDACLEGVQYRLELLINESNMLVEIRKTSDQSIFYSGNYSAIGPISGFRFLAHDDVTPSPTQFYNIDLYGYGQADDMNPAHIVYQCLTDTSWGMGYPTITIDNSSFTAVASALFHEGFGLSMTWSRQETIENFIQIILDHIGGLLYVKPDTGRFALKLIRSDYDRGTLTLYGPDTLIAAENYQRQAWGETINEITVIYTDGASGKDTPVTAHDMANIQIQGGIVSQTRNYPGISSANIAQRVALRDLQSVSTPVARIKLTSTRAAWAVFPGDVFRLSWPEYDIDDVVYRVLAVNRGTLTDGQIIIDAVEDIFGLPDNTYLVEQTSEWEDPSNEPSAAPYRKMIEAPYWDLVRNLSAADMDYVDSLSGYLETVAVRPSGDAIKYRIYAKIGAADYAEEGNGDFCPSATVVSALTKTTSAITVENGVDLDIVIAGGYAVIDNEYVLVSAIDAIAGTATISRGVLDTVPAEHAANSRIFFADDYTGFSTTEYADGEVLDVKLLPITGRGALDIAVAPSDSITFDQRQYRPYPPAGLLFNGVAWPDYMDGEADVVLAWAHRDRTLQTAYIVEQDEASIGPEAGVTYSLEVADEALAVLHSETGISDETATIPASALVTDQPLRFRLWSVRGGLTSWQMHEHFSTFGFSRITEDAEARITEDGEQRTTE